MGRPDLSVLKNKYFAAPMDGVVSKAGEPNPKRYQITYRHQP